MIPPRKLPRVQRGVALLEILVSIVVLAIGLLGYAGLQAVSLKNSASAYQRSQATLLANDIIDRMRANRVQSAPGSYNIAVGSASGGSALAAQDLADWKTLLANALPGGDGSVTVDTNGNVTVTVVWVDKRDGSANQNTTFTTQTNL
jgi:type IV pilus assembly protein PilV